MGEKEAEAVRDVEFRDWRIDRKMNEWVIPKVGGRRSDPLPFANRLAQKKKVERA